MANPFKTTGATYSGSVRIGDVMTGPASPPQFFKPLPGVQFPQINGITHLYPRDREIVNHFAKACTEMGIDLPKIPGYHDQIREALSPITLRQGKLFDYQIVDRALITPEMIGGLPTNLAGLLQDVVGMKKAPPWHQYLVAIAGALSLDLADDEQAAYVVPMKRPSWFAHIGKFFAYGAGSNRHFWRAAPPEPNTKGKVDAASRDAIQPKPAKKMDEGATWRAGSGVYMMPHADEASGDGNPDKDHNNEALLKIRF